MPSLIGIPRGAVTDAMKAETRAIAAGLRRAVERTGRQVQEELRAQVRAAGFKDGGRAMANAWRLKTFPAAGVVTFHPAALVFSMMAFYEATRMISEIVWLPLTTPPPRCLWANGQNVSRTTYAALFAALGTIFGVGDGTTTFGLPDLRGRTLFGKDDMGGTAAARLTSAGSGVDGLTLGAVGGSQFLHGHTHTATDSGHNHSITDPGHTHTSNASQTPVSSPGVGIAGSGTGWSFNGATIASATTGISIATGTANVTNATTGSGTSQNMPPSMVMNAFIYAGA